MKSVLIVSLFIALIAQLPMCGGEKGETPPVAIQQPMPDYGPELSKYYLNDPVKVEMLIDSRGTPVVLNTPDSIPDSLVESLSQWRFRPGKKDGVETPFSITLTVQVHRAISDVAHGAWFPSTRALAEALKDGTGLDASSADRIEEELKLDLQNLDKRSSLLLYAIESASRIPEDAMRARARHIGWLVQNLPDSAILSSPLVLVNTTAGALPDPDGYQQIRALWLQQLAQSPLAAGIVERSSKFLRVSDPEKTEQILLPLVNVVRGAAGWLGELYGSVALGVTARDLRTGLAVAAGQRLPETDLARKARQAMTSASDARIVLASASAFTEAGRSLATLKRLPEGYGTFCEQVVAWAREVYPKTSVSCDPSAPIPERSRQIERIRVGGNVQQAQLIKKVQPIYPDEAKSRRIQGKVEFSTVIGKDGKIQSLELVGGPLVFYHAARDAVRRWEYRPTLLNGQPVEVLTRIDVNYTMSSR